MALNDAILKWYNKIILFLSIGLFIFSLTQKCFCTNVSCGDSSAALFSGTFGFFSSPAGFTWLANPAVLFSWIYLNKKTRQSLIASIIAVALCISFLFFKRIMVDEAGNYGQIISYKSGYWLWMSSMVVMLIGNLTLHLLKKRGATDNL